MWSARAACGFATPPAQLLGCIKDNLALSLAIAYAMAENCVAIGPIPNTWEQDIYVQLKQKKKNAEDPIDGVDEAFARGMPESDFMFKPSKGLTGVADPYKEMTPW